MASKVSVVIPTHNRASLAKRAIESVRKQTYKELEIIVVDDASSDETPAVIADIRDDRLRYIRHDRSMGGAAARNTGIQAATGDYIAFLDDDDEWEPEKTAEQLKVLKQYDAVLCMSTTGSDRDINSLAAKKTSGLEDLRRGMPPVGGTSALMGREHLIKDLQFDESLPRCQDWDLLIRLANRCVIGYVPKRLVRYNNGDHLRITNVATKVDLAITEQERRLKFFDKHREFFGTRWYRIHVSRALLSGVRRQSRPFRQILYTVHKCGILPVLRALARALYQKLSGNV